MIEAKPVIPEKYWILRHKDRKIGEIEAVDTSFQVRINNTTRKFENRKILEQNFNIEFADPIIKSPQVIGDSVNGYPTDGPAYNGIYDASKRLPLFTKSESSKSWFAAGWYMVKQGSRWQAEFCPKLITLQRYQFVGPVKSRQDLTFK